MASLWRRAMVYLGLQDDDEFDDYADYDYEDEDGTEQPPPVHQPREVAPVRELQGAPQGPVMARSQTEFRDQAPLDTGLVRPVPRDDPPGMTPPRPAVVRTHTTSARVHVVEPQGFNDAQELGDRLKASQPVMLNLRGLSRELQRRLIDFSSGLAYAVGATMQKVDDHVFLLTPTNVEVSQEEKERLRAKGLFRV
jgi:cell division inhibitor SepF